MALRLSIVAVLFIALTGGMASAGTIVRVQVIEAQNPIGPATRPTALIPNATPANTLLTVDALADANGRFLARTAAGEQIIELNGSIKSHEDASTSVRISFSDRVGLGTTHVTTNITLGLNQPVRIGWTQGLSGGDKNVVLTLIDEPAK